MDVLSFVHIKKMTPAPAVLFHAVVALGMVLSGSIEGLIDFFRWLLLELEMNLAKLEVSQSRRRRFLLVEIKHLLAFSHL